MPSQLGSISARRGRPIGLSGSGHTGVAVPQRLSDAVHQRRALLLLVDGAGRLSYPISANLLPCERRAPMCAISAPIAQNVKRHAQVSHTGLKLVRAQTEVNVP